MSTKKDVNPLKIDSNPVEELFSLDLESTNLSMSAAVVEFRALGQLKLIDVVKHEKDNPFYADITGIPGVYEYKIQGADTVYSLGADTVITLLLAIDAESPVMTKDMIVKMQSLKFKIFHSKLRTARKKK